MTRRFEANPPHATPGVALIENGRAVETVCLCPRADWAQRIARALNAAEGDRRAIAAELAEAMNAASADAPHPEALAERASKGECSGARGGDAGAHLWNPPLEWRWYHGGAEDAEVFFGACATREQAIAGALGDLNWRDAEDDGTGRWIASFHVMEAAKAPLRLSRYVDTEELLDRAEDRASEDAEYVGENDDNPFFDAMPEQISDLAARIDAACDAWQTEHGIFYRPYLFSHTRGGETLTFDFTEERAAALAAEGDGGQGGDASTASTDRETVSGEAAPLPEGVEIFEGRPMKVVNPEKSGWWRYHSHYDRDGYCDNPGRGY